MKKISLTRRRFLATGASVIALAGFLYRGGSGYVQARTSSQESLPDFLKNTYKPDYFSNEEWSFLLAACDRLIPADERGPGALEALVPVFIDRQMNEPYGKGELWYMNEPFSSSAPEELGYQLQYPPRDIYRLGIGQTDKFCMQEYGKHFCELDHQRQEEILHRLEKGDIDLTNIPSGTFFTFLWTNTKEGFLSDPKHGGNKDMAGWKLVGFPGARADFMDWIEQPNRPYPFGPVSIDGARG